MFFSRVSMLGLVVAVVCAQPAPAQTPYPVGLYGEIHTPKGMIVIRLEFERTPMTVANFVGLAEGTVENAVFPLGRRFFDGSTFHRVVAGHVIQGGSPAVEDAEGSGKPIPNEIDTTLSHRLPGTVGMASSGPHTATSQFYITLGDRAYLDGNYVLFGEVVRGMEVVDAIVRDDAIDSVRIVRVGERAAAFRPTTASWQELVDAVRERVTAQEERRRIAEAEHVRRNWPNAVATDSGWRYAVLQPGTGGLPFAGDTLTVRYTGHTVGGLRFQSSGESGQPDWPVPGADRGNTFRYVVGTSELTPGLDQAIAQMKAGERRVVIVPAAMAYGISGYYAPSVPGQRRFVISPHTLLIYEIEVRTPD